MLNLFGVKITETIHPYYFYENAEDALTWQLKQADIPFRIVKHGTPEWKTIKPAHEAPKEFQKELNNQDIILVPFTEKDFYYRILDKVFDDDFYKEDMRQQKEEWVAEFGPDVPFGCTCEPEYDENWFTKYTTEEIDQMLAKYTKSGKIEKRTEL